MRGEWRAASTLMVVPTHVATRQPLRDEKSAGHLLSQTQPQSTTISPSPPSPPVTMGRIKQEEVIDLIDSAPVPSHKRNLQLLEEAFGVGSTGDDEEPSRKRPRPLSLQEPYQFRLPAAASYREVDAFNYRDVDAPVNHRAADSHTLNYDDSAAGYLYEETERQKVSYGEYPHRYPKTLFSYEETQSQPWGSDTDVLRYLVDRNPFQDPRTKGDEYVGDLRIQIQELQDFLVKETGKKRASFSAYRIYEDIGIENLLDPLPSDYERQLQWLYEFIVTERLVLKTPDSIRRNLDNQFGADKVLADAIYEAVDQKYGIWTALIESGQGESSDDLSRVMCPYVRDIDRLSYVGARGLHFAWDLIIYLGKHTYSNLENGGAGFGYRPSDKLIDDLCCALAKRRKGKRKGWRPKAELLDLLSHATTLSMCFWEDIKYPGECSLFRNSIDLLEDYVESRLISGEKNILLDYGEN